MHWKPGAILLTDFDIKIGRLSASVRKQTLTTSDIECACSEADSAIYRIMREDHVRKQRHNKGDNDRANKGLT